jgi:hypothetical protein
MKPLLNFVTSNALLGADSRQVISLPESKNVNTEIEILKYVANN